ncbi:MAG TPA: tyrosine-type recombinase/integrase [Xanthobacteraceae bacterium]
MSKIRLAFVQAFRDRYGKPRFYFRRHGQERVALPGLPGSKEFMAAYQLALAQGATAQTDIGASRTIPGTIGALVVAYYTSTSFQSLSPEAQTTYRSIIEGIRREHGDKRVAAIKREHIEAMQGKRIRTPAAANNWLRMIRMLMKFAVAKSMRPDDPTFGVQPIKTAVIGFHTWSEEDIETFEKRHPVGSKARLAMTLMLYTGCRRGDAVLLAPQNIKRGFLTYTQQKNRRRKPITLTIPVHPKLARIIEATPTVGLTTFLVTNFGKPFTAAGFGNWMRDRCNEAKLPECSSHGLRKAIARRLAEAGMSAHQIMAITGHTTLKEVERYTREASQKLMAQMAMRGLSGAPLSLIEGGKGANRTGSELTDLLSNSPQKIVKP